MANQRLFRGTPLLSINHKIQPLILRNGVLIFSPCHSRLRIILRKIHFYKDYRLGTYGGQGICKLGYVNCSFIKAANRQ